MATNTTNFGLVKPAYADTADIADINGNMDTIDTVMKNNKDATLGIASIITGDTNNSGHAISNGEYFIANGTKYKATASIPSGGSWSNSKASVSDHDLVNALSAKIDDTQKFKAGDVFYMPFFCPAYSPSSDQIRFYAETNKEIPATGLSFTKDFTVNKVYKHDGTLLNIPENANYTITRISAFQFQVAITGLTGVSTNNMYFVYLSTTGNRRVNVVSA